MICIQELTKPIAKAAPAEQTRKYRHQFFQTQNIVEVAVLAKNLTPDRVNVTIEERSLRVVIKSPEGDGEYDLPVDLYDKVGLEFIALEQCYFHAQCLFGVIHSDIVWHFLTGACMNLPVASVSSYVILNKCVFCFTKEFCRKE